MKKTTQKIFEFDSTPPVSILPVTTTVETITPTIAKQYLLKNHPNNRPVRSNRIYQWVDDIKKGRWILTHQGIAFDREGFLVDGQHRLTAIVSADMAVPMMVTRNVDSEVFKYVDQGAMRTAADVLRLSNRKVAALRNLIRLETYGAAVAEVRTAEILDRMSGDQTDLAALDRVLSLFDKAGNRNPFFVGATFAALAYAHPTSPNIVESFGHQLNTGELLTREDPAHRLREWCLKRKSTSSGSMWEIMMATLQALHHHLKTTQPKIAMLIVGETGYRWVTTRRRVLRLLNTPTAKDVVTFSTRRDVE
jgi:hypothetical protein